MNEPGEDRAGRSYDPGAVERKWQARWDASRTFVRRPGSGPKWYVIELPPFATGKLHLGHARNYVLADAGVRFRRMAGYDVLYTTGYDSFGLPSEIAARDLGTHPNELIETCIVEMGQALRRLGLSHDPKRITAYHVPEYYRWVQWVFLRLLAHGHCENRKGPVLWCPSCDASLAESLIEDGRCWRCKSPAETRRMPQWYVKETHFADAMLSGLENLPGWPDTVRRIHADWIGRRNGRKVELKAPDGSTVALFVEDNVPLGRAVAVGLPADHPLAGTNAMLHHPDLPAPLPAIAMSERLLPAPDAVIPLVPGINPGHDRVLAEQALLHHLAPESPTEPDGVPATIYRLRDWSIARQRYWGPPVPVVHCAGCGIVPVDEEALPVLLPHLPLDDAGNPLAADPGFRDTLCPKCKGAARRDTDTFEAYSSPWWYHWMCMEAGDVTPFDRGRASQYLPVDLMIGGNDQIRSCFFHVRMIAKALAAIGVVEVDEPVERLLAIGMIQSEGRKMSKAAGNALPLDALIERYGADAVRFAVLGAAAPDRDVNWNEATAIHAAGLLARIARFDQAIATPDVAGDGSSTQRKREKLARWVETATHKITANLVRHQYQLVPRNLEMLLDRLVQFASQTGPRRCAADGEALRGAWDVFVRLLAPAAPHLAEELWEAREHAGLVACAAWPAAVESEVRIPPRPESEMPEDIE